MGIVPWPHQRNDSQRETAVEEAIDIHSFV